MLKNLIICSLYIVATKAIGEFTILNAPESLSFEGNDPIESHDIGEVVSVSLGSSVSGESQWSGLKIANPFKLPKHAIFVSLNGVEHSKLSDAGKTYKVQGNTVEKSLNAVSTYLEDEGKKVCANIFADENFSQGCGYLNEIADNLADKQRQCDFIYINLSVDGGNPKAIAESLNDLFTAVKHLKTVVQESSNNDTIVVVVVNKPDGSSRSKRDVAPDNEKIMYNLAEYYNQDYPVIFNIILWFMVVFGFALLAICYAIGSMDPGRDSIIYRMTSTRMKKDN